MVGPSVYVSDGLSWEHVRQMKGTQNDKQTGSYATHKKLLGKSNCISLDGSDALMLPVFCPWILATLIAMDLRCDFQDF